MSQALITQHVFEPHSCSCGRKHQTENLKPEEWRLLKQHNSVAGLFRCPHTFGNRLHVSLVLPEIKELRIKSGGGGCEGCSFRASTGGGSDSVRWGFLWRAESSPSGSHVGSVCRLLGSVSVKLLGAKNRLQVCSAGSRKELTAVLIICSHRGGKHAGQSRKPGKFNLQNKSANLVA